ncbi:response regulator transcription factor [Cupriavidus plantarum]|uniref:response regulator transcription factor n=1 Tax=Cupriavidus plantarum TaxID=942865 RepID=UPI000EAE9ED9|nr:response regulator transcription factor [Cupriavidus plantarum]RLK36068.1 DNA-binding response OmpR family regulator [Cupriavidus plantarum]
MDIAVLDENPTRVLMLERALGRGAHRCTRFRHGTALIDAMRHRSFDALLLDRDNHGTDVRELVRIVRRSFGHGVPLMVLSEACEEADVVGCLRDGADACLRKPVRDRELVARVAALARRAAAPFRQAGKLEAESAGGTCRLPGDDLPPLIYGRYRFDIGERRAWVRDCCVTLTPKEFALALLLFRHLGALVTRRLMADQVWRGAVREDARTIDSHLSRVRGKLALWPHNGVALHRMRGLGWRLDPV